MKSFIYIIQNKINNKLYIGKTINPKERWLNHLKFARGGKIKYPNDFFAIHGAISKYGENNFSFQIIEEFNNEKESLDAECFWIEYLESYIRKNGYNLTMGGDGVLSPSKENILKKSLRFKGENSPHSKLTEKQVIEIIKLHNDEKYSQRELSKIFNVHFATISSIIKKKSWIYLSKNIIMKKRKYQNRYGELTKVNKLSEKQVIEIINLYKTGKHTHKSISKIFNISRINVGSIINCVTWKHITR